MSTVVALCPRGGPREIRDGIDIALKEWDAKYADDVAALTGCPAS